MVTAVPGHYRGWPSQKQKREYKEPLAGPAALSLIYHIRAIPLHQEHAENSDPAIAAAQEFFEAAVARETFTSRLNSEFFQ